MLASKMFNVLQPLPWDTHFLNLGVARLMAHSLEGKELEKILAEANAQDIKLLYVIVAPDDSLSQATATAAGALLADRKVTFGMRLAPAEANTTVPPAVVSAELALVTQLEQLALQSGIYSRYRRDPRMPSGTFVRLYKQWLHNSINKNLAREVLMYRPLPLPEETNTVAPPLGLLTLGEKNGRADIGLLAVDNTARGMGLGQQLVAVARQRTASWGLSELQVVTQLDNEAACAFYQKCGFAVWQLEFIYHLWLD